MKNGIKFALTLLGLCILTACTNTVEGMKKDTTDLTDWAHNKPSQFGDAIGPAPIGYRYGTKNAVPAPEENGEESFAPVETRPLSNRAGYVDDRGAVWHQINGYNAEEPSLPSSSEDFTSGGQEGRAAPAVIKYSPSVDVYPVNADTEPYAQQIAVGGIISPVSGELVQQIFFPYGSASISSIERQNLRELAQSLANNGKQYRLDVVGHASKKVNHVRSALKRKMINFKMAQRRADAVTALLVKAGATPDWVVATSAGDSQPNPHRNGKSREAADQRAEVYLNN